MEVTNTRFPVPQDPGDLGQTLLLVNGLKSLFAGCHTFECTYIIDVVPWPLTPS